MLRYDPFNSGDNVYVIDRNPHTQSVAQIQEGSIVRSPYNPNELALYYREEYYPLTDAFAIFTSYEEAYEAYQSAFQSNDRKSCEQQLYGDND